jgi:poly-gamma-glutamate synthesis protein (capsule biosynthesis protein)
MKKNKVSILIAILSIIVFFVIIFLFVRNSKIFSTSVIDEDNLFFSNNIFNNTLQNVDKVDDDIQVNNLGLEEEDKELKLLFFGDIMLDRNVLNVIEKNSLDYILEKLKEDNFLAGYDFIVANLEGAVTNNGDRYRPINLYDFAFNPDLVAKFRDYGFNVFSLANNHLADQGEKGIAETYGNLSKLGFNYFGCKDAFLSPDDDFPLVTLNDQELLDNNNCSAVIMEKKDKKIAFLSFSIVYKRIDETDIVEKINKLKEVSDYVIVVPHWGLEYKGLASREQEILAHKMIDAGADIIIGHHPHVIQNKEMYNGKEIYYSLGNFIFDQYFSPETQEGLAVSLDLKKGDIETKVYKLKTRYSKVTEVEEFEF